MEGKGGDGLPEERKSLGTLYPLPWEEYCTVLYTFLANGGREITPEADRSTAQHSLT